MDQRDFIEEFLGRICYEGHPEANLECLKAIHRHHLLNVPFENLDILKGSPIALSTEALYEKIVKNNRGGICYELNGLFEVLLTYLGFKIDVLAGQVLEDGDTYDHQFLMVHLDNQAYLADVGFGDNFFEPIKFELNTIQQDPKGWFKIIEKAADTYELLQSPDGIDYVKAYSFSMKPRNKAEFVERCKWFESSPESRFRRNRLCSLERENGRISMKDTKLIVTANNQRTEYSVESEACFERYLRTHFNIMEV